MSNKISEVTKRDIKDLFSCGVSMQYGETGNISWHGRLDDIEFLQRLYNLDELPSYDSRYHTAKGDIATHVGFGDWEDEWVFTDERFGLMNGNDETYLRFICEIFHPAVARHSIEDEDWAEAEFYRQISNLLKTEGYELYEVKRLGNKPVLGWRVIGSAETFISAQTEALKDVFDSDYLQQQIDQMQKSISSNPTDAIGKAKEIVESCCKTILEEHKKEIDKNWEVPKLVKETCKILNLLPDNVPNGIQGEDTIRRILANLSAIPHGLAELRNPYGSGHGKSNSFSGLEGRHARLAVGAAASVCWFLWETHISQKEH